jgi:hypothetical protein
VAVVAAVVKEQMLMWVSKVERVLLLFVSPLLFNLLFNGFK